MEWPTVCLERGIGNNGMVSLDAYQSEGTYHLDITAVETLHPLTGYGHLIKVRTFAELIESLVNLALDERFYKSLLTF